jgi:tetratricopeptide (TPR) repeat protein
MSNIAKSTEQIVPSSNISVDSLSEKKFTTAAVCTILLFIAVVYANSISNDFTNYDDLSLVVENPAIRSLSIDNLLNIFTPKPGLTFQPVRVLSYAIDYHFWKLNPVGYHLGNIALHCGAAIWLYLLLTAILNRIRGESLAGEHRIIALLATLLFVVHPVNVEAVTWLSSRKYGLLAFFYFCSTYLFVKSTQKERRYLTYYLVSVGAYLLTLLSSPFAVTLPAILLLYDVCSSKDNNLYIILRFRLSYYLPYILLSIPYFIIQWYSLTTTPGPQPVIKDHYVGNLFYTFLTMLRVLYDYFRNLIFPFWLNNTYVDYTSTSIFEYKIIISLIVILLFVAILWMQVKAGNKLGLFCLGWFILTWLPVSNIIPISTKIADRYLYLPAVGVFLFFSASLYKIPQIWFGKKVKQFVIFPLVVLLVFSLSYLSIQRNRVWANSQTLWEDSLRKAPNYWVPYLNLGLTMAQQGKIDQALYYYYEALRLNPNSVLTHNNLGVALLEQGKIDEAIRHYTAALRLKSDYAETYNNLGVAWFTAGEFDKAMAYYREGLRLDPSFGKAHNNMGNALVEKGRFEEAILHYTKALETKAHYPEAHNNLGVALAQQGKLEEAIVHFKEALRLKPDYAQARANLDLALALVGEATDAPKSISAPLK